MKLKTELILGLILLGMVLVPSFSGIDPQISNSNEAKEPEIGEVTEYGTYLGNNQVEKKFGAPSKAQSIMLAEEDYFGVWGGGGDGSVYSDGGGWDYGSYIAVLDTFGQEAYFSFDMEGYFEDANNIKSIDEFYFEASVYDEGLEGGETVRIKKLDTTKDCGNNAEATYCDEKEEIARSHAQFIGFKTGSTDTGAFTTTGWKAVDISGNSWLVPGSMGNGYITLYLKPQSNWVGTDWLQLYTRNSASNDPYLTVVYTLYTAPTAASGDITGEPSRLEPGSTYQVSTIIRDVDDRGDIKNAYLYVSADHVNYRVRFDWVHDSDQFSTGENPSYLTLNTGSCSSANEGSIGYTLTWDFTVTWDWVDGSMDWGNYAIDEEVKNSGLNWNNQNTPYSDDLHLHSLTVRFDRTLAPAGWTLINDGDWVENNTLIHAWGYYYYAGSTAVPATYASFDVGLVIDGTNLGSEHNATLNSSGFFNITSYTSEGAVNIDWSIDVILITLPSGAGEGSSDDNGRQALYLSVTPPGFQVSPSEYSWTLNYTYPNLNDVIETQTTKTHYNETQRRVWVSIMVWEDSATVVISGIPTTWTYSEINPNATVTDYISVNGSLKLTNTYMGTYILYIDTLETWHFLFLSAEVPDGLTVRWDTFHWRFNGTEATTNPWFMEHGYYDFTIKDNYEQTVKSGNITIASTDELQVSWADQIESEWGTGEARLPLYKVGIQNLDKVAYYLEIERGVTTWQPLPETGLVIFRLYGLASGQNYTVTVKKVFDDSIRGTFTIVMKDKAYSRAIKYETEETVDFEVFLPSTIIEDTPATVSGSVYWTNGTVITSFDAYIDWDDGLGYETTTATGNSFYASNFYDTPETKQIDVRIVVSGEDNVTKSYLINVQESEFSTDPILGVTIPSKGVVNTDYTVHGSVFYSTGEGASGNVTVYWGTGEGNENATLLAGLFSSSHNYTSTGSYLVSVLRNESAVEYWQNSTVSIEAAYTGETAPDIEVTYWFDDDDSTLIFITVTTNLGDCLVNVTENGTPKFSAQSETLRLAYEKATAVGTYNVTTQVYKTGYTTRTFFSSYTVVSETLYILEYSGIHWVSDTYVQVIIHTSWGNSTITVEEETNAGTKTVFETAPGEGTVSWEGDHTQNYVNVTLTINGGTQSLTWYDGYYYVKAEPSPGGVAQVIRGLQPSDLILPAFLLLGGFAIIGNWNQKRGRIQQKREGWRQQQVRAQGASSMNDLHPYDRRKVREAEEKRYGKSRFKRGKKQ